MKEYMIIFSIEDNITTSMTVIARNEKEAIKEAKKSCRFSIIKVKEVGKESELK